eukprot:gene664-959_t
MVLAGFAQVDVIRLPKPVEACDTASHVAPRNERERILQGVWQQVLGLKHPPSVEADFFTELGALLFSNRTIAALAEVVDVLLSTASSAPPACVSRTWPDNTRPLSSNQQQMWWLRELAAAAAYNLPLVVSLEGDLNPQHLQEAVNVLVARHEVLRMCFQEIDSGVVGVVLFQFLPETTAAELDLPWGEARSSQFMAEGWERETCHMDLAFEVHGRCISATYSTELFNASTIQSMLHSFLQLLQQLVDSPEKPATCATLLDSADQQTVLQWGAGPQQVQQIEAPLAHEAFARAAANKPDSCCLVFENEQLSYAAVEQRATTLAAALQAAGVGPGVAVGVLLERSLELPIAVLAVFMAGGCYVPLDPSYPEQRLQGYLEDSGSVLVLTTSRLSQLAADVTNAPSKVEVDVNRLPMPAESCDAASYAAPHSLTEQLLQEVWQQVLGLSQPPSVEADFFTELGGSSLQSFLIMAAARDVLQLRAAPPAALLFSNRTIAALAATVRAVSAQDVPDLPACVAHTWPDSTRPLSKNQQQMWMLRNLSGS